MADLDIEPFFTMKKAFDEENLPDAVKFEATVRGNKKTGRVIPDSGDKSIEFFYEVTHQQFLELVDELSLTGVDKWKKFRKCLMGNLKTVWDEVVDSDYPNAADKTAANFNEAIEKMVCKFLNCEQPRNVMLTHIAPNGGLMKDPFVRAETHSLRWKTMIRVIKQLPKGQGDISIPSKKLELIYFYHTFCKKHRLRYKSSGRKWKDETHAGLVEFMSNLHQEDLDNGSLQKLAMQKAEKELKKKARANYRSSNSRQRATYEADRRPYRKPYREDRGSDKRYERSSSSRYDAGRSKNKSYHRSDGRSSSSKSKSEHGKFCPKHGPGHTWDECKSNPKNQRGGRHESHHQDASSVGESDNGSVVSTRSGRSSVSHRSGDSKQNEDVFAMELLKAKKRNKKGKKKTKKAKMAECDRIPKRKREEDEESEVADEGAFANMGFDGAAADDEEGQLDG